MGGGAVGYDDIKIIGINFNFFLIIRVNIGLTSILHTFYIFEKLFLKTAYQ